MAQLVGASSCAPKGCGFDPQSGDVQEATDQCFSHIDISLSQIKKKNIYMCMYFINELQNSGKSLQLVVVVFVIK